MKLKSVLGILALVGVAALAVNLIFFDKGPQPAAFKASTNVIEVTDQNFEEEVLNSKVPVVIDFNATWCAPCKQYKPIFHKVADQYVGKVKFISIDVDQAPGVATLFGLKAIPITVFLSETDSTISGTAAPGALTEDQLKQMVEDSLKPTAKLKPFLKKKPIDVAPAAPDAPKSDDAPAVEPKPVPELKK
jgi:thioredoxin 1